MDNSKLLGFWATQFALGMSKNLKEDTKLGSMVLDGVRRYICLKCIVCVYEILVINILHLKKRILAQMGMLWTHMRLFSFIFLTMGIIFI